MTTTPSTTTTLSHGDGNPLSRKHLYPHVLMQTGYERQDGGWDPVISLATIDGGFEIFDFRTPEEPAERFTEAQAMDAVRRFHALHADL